MTVLGCFSLQSYFLFSLFGDPLKSWDTEEYSLGKHARIALFTFALYLGMNYFSTISFGLTSPGSASIIASSCGFFTLLVGRMAGVESLSWFKVAGVLISAGGVALLGIADFTDAGNTTAGNICALLGAALYGVHSTVLKKATGDESKVSTLTLFAFVGLYVTLTSAPIFLVLHLTGMETFELPPNGRIWLYIVINILFGSLIPNYLWNIAFLYTNQLIVAIGISFTTPLTLLVEYFQDEAQVTWQKIASAACLTLAFGLVNIAELRPDLDRKID